MLLLLTLLTLAAPVIAALLVAGLWSNVRQAVPVEVTRRVRLTRQPGVRCAYCHDSMPGEVTARCPHCRALLHTSCWDENRGCTTLGCRLTVARGRGPALALAGQER